MALNFPGSPTNGQQYNGFVYNSTVQAWQSNPASVAPFYTADMPPTNPTKGDSWFNTNDGTMYIYTYDGNTYQWVEHRSQIAKSQVALSPVVPTSVTLGSGTATTNTLGTVTFNGVSAVALNGIFTSAYKNYRIVLNQEGTSTTSGQDLMLRFRTSGTDVTTGNYYWGGQYIRIAGTGGYLSGNATTALRINYSHTIPFVVSTMDIFNPQANIRTNFIMSSLGQDSTGVLAIWSNGTVDLNNQFDGLNIYPTGGTFNGSITVYGYNA